MANPYILADFPMAPNVALESPAEWETRMQTVILPSERKKLRHCLVDQGACPFELAGVKNSDQDTIVGLIARPDFRQDALVFRHAQSKRPRGDASPGA